MTSLARGVVVAAAVLAGSTVQAQTICETDCVVAEGAPFSAFTDLDSEATGYQMLVDGVADPDAPSVISGGLIEFFFDDGLPVAGAYVLAIAATRPDGTLETEPKTLTVLDATAPLVAITSISQAGKSHNYTVGASATDPSGIVRVEFFVDGALQSSLNTEPYTAQLVIKAKGTHTVMVSALDGAGNWGSATTQITR